MSALTFDLPLPPSVNRLTVNLKGGGRAKSAEYKAWLEEARWHVMTGWRNAGKPEIADRPMRVDIELGIEGRKRDCSNCIKAIEDLLCANMPIPDDRWNDAGSWRRNETIPGIARVTIAPIEQEESG